MGRSPAICPLCPDGAHRPLVETCNVCHAHVCKRHILPEDGAWLCSRCKREGRQPAQPAAHDPSLVNRMREYMATRRKRVWQPAQREPRPVRARCSLCPQSRRAPSPEHLCITCGNAVCSGHSRLAVSEGGWQCLPCREAQT